MHIAIDDFGTGYSSLSYLKRWRVDTLKIDRSFVRDLVTDMSDLAIVSAIIAMARHLHIKVVAEGIEGWPQLEKLRQLGCSYAQGYLFARPSPAADCMRLLTGAPLDLTQRLPALDMLESTGSGEQCRPCALNRAFAGGSPANLPASNTPRPAPGAPGAERARMGHGFGSGPDRRRWRAAPAVRGRGAHGAAEGLRL